jgi:DNA-binding NarL/FixJ family response regulator
MDGPAKIRILIVDDHAVVRKGLAMVLKLEPDFEVVGEAGDGAEALHLAAQLRPDLVLLDRKMPSMDGLEAAQALRDALPQTKVLILTGAELDSGVYDLLAAGAAGYVLKDIDPQELKQAIRLVASGEAYLHPAVARMVLDRVGSTPQLDFRPQLTPRELEVLHWLYSPLTYRQVAEQLHISQETVRSHAKHILDKLGQPNRAQAVLAAMRMGLVEVPGKIP